MAKKTTTRKTVRVLKKKAAPKAPSKSKKKAVAEIQAPEIVFKPSEHVLVPRHEILTQEEVENLFTMYHVSPQNLPLIFIGDAGLTGLDAKMGDIVRITRASPTAGTAVYYRRVSYE